MIKFKLEDLLNKKGMTMYSLAKATGVRPNTISQWFNNESLEDDKKVKSISVETLDKICTILECEIEDIIQFIPNKK
ncbi:helix-turn-helix transcriptional regulator [Metabacillus fastidiosus]|uniref:helix-turn-helix domain-containing protein n=1 Tax=Metabacillus fastidiosus TaxID=1458 RepID=UPI003D2B5743